MSSSPDSVKRKHTDTDTDHQKKKKKTKISEEDNICTICLEPCEDKTQCCSLTCGHTFHSECIWSWLIDHKTCPICRDGTMRCQHYKESTNKKDDKLWFIKQHSHTDVPKTIVASMMNEIKLLKNKIQEHEDRQLAMSLTNPITLLFNTIR
jgi:hypothetical protein